MKIKIIVLLSICFLFGCGTNRTIQKQTFKYSVEKPIEGQIYTAERLREFMDTKEYEKAIKLFSKKQQENIELIKKNEDDVELFQYWCYAWTFDSAKFNRYLLKIKNNQAHFIFENGEWKIDEK
jgi:hypothetical protein